MLDRSGTSDRDHARLSEDADADHRDVAGTARGLAYVGGSLLVSGVLVQALASLLH